MIITRILSLGFVLMFALIATSDAVYAENPCCTFRDGTWVVIKTGKPASPAQVRTMEAPTKGVLKRGARVVTQSNAASPKGTTGSSTGGTTSSSNPAPAESHGGGGHK